MIHSKGSKYRVEVFKNENWLVYSRHKNFDYAEANADQQSKKYSVRIIHSGKIIYQVDKA
jgi:hypothetical protein